MQVDCVATEAQARAAALCLEAHGVHSALLERLRELDAEWAAKRRPVENGAREVERRRLPQAEAFSHIERALSQARTQSRFAPRRLALERERAMVDRSVDAEAPRPRMVDRSVEAFGPRVLLEEERRPTMVDRSVEAFGASLRPTMVDQSVEVELVGEDPEEEPLEYRVIKVQEPSPDNHEPLDHHEPFDDKEPVDNLGSFDDIEPNHEPLDDQESFNDIEPNHEPFDDHESFDDIESNHEPLDESFDNAHHMELPCEDELLQHNSATAIQAAIRGHLVRQRLEQEAAADALHRRHLVARAVRALASEAATRYRWKNMMRKKTIRWGRYIHRHGMGGFDAAEIFSQEGKMVMAREYYQWRLRALALVRWEFATASHSTEAHLRGCPVDEIEYEL